MKTKLSLNKMIVILTLLTLTISGCSTQNKEPETGGADVSIKIDKTKPFIYATDESTISLQSILSESGRLDQYTSILSHFNSSLLPKQPEENIFSNQKLFINIESEQARELQENLNKINQEYSEIQERAKDAILNEESGFFSWAGLTMIDSFESEKYVSFIIVNRTFGSPGHSQMSLDGYIFDAQTGEKIESPHFLESLDLTSKKIEDYLVEMVFTEKIPSDEEFLNRQIVHDLSEAQQKYKEDPTSENIFVRIKPENGYAIRNNDLSIIIEAYSSMDDVFRTLQVIEVPLSKLQ